MTFSSLISCPRTELLVASAHDCQRLFLQLEQFCLHSLPSHDCSPQFPVPRLGTAKGEGPLSGAAVPVEGKRGRDVAGSKKNMNLTFSERVNWFIARQQWGFCILSSSVFLFLVIGPGCGFDCVTQHGSEWGTYLAQNQLLLPPHTQSPRGFSDDLGLFLTFSSLIFIKL